MAGVFSGVGEEGLYSEGWSTNEKFLPSPHWKTAIFFLTPQHHPPHCVGDNSTPPPTTGLVKLNPLIVEKVKELCQGKGWFHLTDELSDGMQRFASVCVTLRSGRLVVNEEDELPEP